MHSTGGSHLITFLYLSFSRKLHRLLLHTETPDGSVVPVWEEVQTNEVELFKGIMTSRNNAQDIYYTRIPITAEHPPDSSDLHDLIDVVVRADPTNTPIVVNCQRGRGRSTLAVASNLHPRNVTCFC
jgi:protein-tyrosine phosphatase